jgi:D-tyrosyl-tRNA(Tyr) deacylase
MRTVIQRVSEAKVTVKGEIVGEINQGLLVLLGVSTEDAEKDALYLLEKTLNLRIFEDAAEKMNLSLIDVRGELLVVSQFTLYGDARRGRRPSFIKPPRPKKPSSFTNFLSPKQKNKSLVSPPESFRR